MIRQSAILVILPVVLIGAFAVPLGFWRGSYQWLCGGVAAGLTVTAGLVTFLAADQLTKMSPLGPVLALFLGTFVRLVMGLGGGLLVFFGAGSTFRVDPISFWLWLLSAYLITLVVETVLLARK